MTAAYPLAPTPPHPFGLPQGTVRGFLSVLICSFFWIVLLLPRETPTTIPLAHFFLLTLVFLAFASNHHSPDHKLHVLPWLMRMIFVGGSLAVIAYMGYRDPARLSARLTPGVAEIGQWPMLLATLSCGFALGMFLRFVLRPRSQVFQTMRAWVGVLAMLLLLFETIVQFVIIPNMDSYDPNKLMVWEATLVALVAAYFGTRA